MDCTRKDRPPGLVADRGRTAPQFFFDCDGYLTSIVDKNGNTMRFTYEVRRSNNKPTKFLRYITDPAGRQTPDHRLLGQGRHLRLHRRQHLDQGHRRGNLTNPQIIDHVRTITDISGRTLTFTYTDKGLLGRAHRRRRLRRQPEGVRIPYDITQGNKNVKLVRVTDPRGHATALDYY